MAERRRHNRSRWATLKRADATAEDGQASLLSAAVTALTPRGVQPTAVSMDAAPCLTGSKRPAQGGVVMYLITPPDAQRRTAVSCLLRPGVQRGGSQSRHRQTTATLSFLTRTSIHTRRKYQITSEAKPFRLAACPRRRPGSLLEPRRANVPHYSCPAIEVRRIPVYKSILLVPQSGESHLLSVPSWRWILNHWVLTQLEELDDLSKVRESAR